jgi:SSS family solute:Na+ symporter
MVAPYVYKARYGVPFPVNGQYMWLFAMVGATVIYVLVSLATYRRERAFDIEKMLHRGSYALPGAQAEKACCPSIWQRIMGVTDEFTKGDRVLAALLVLWNAAFFALFAVVSIVSLLVDIPATWWARYWHFSILLNLAVGVPATILLTIGGVVDMKRLFATLREAPPDTADDGRVMAEGEHA